MREGRLTPEAIERMLFPLLDGLEEVHAIGFLHRDIKPANIMVDARGRPTLIDFGAARAAMAGRIDDDDGDLHAGLCGGRAVHLGRAGAVDRHLRAFGYALSRHHRQDPAERDRSHAARHLRAAERTQARRLSRPSSWPASMPGLVVPSESGPEHRRMAARAAHGRAPVSAAAATQRRPQAAPTVLAHAAPKAGRRPAGPALWGSDGRGRGPAGGGGYLVFVAERPATTSQSPSALTAEQLEQALAERRKADTSAAEKRQLEEEARRRPTPRPRPSGRPMPSSSRRARPAEGRSGAGRAQGPTSRRSARRSRASATRRRQRRRARPRRPRSARPRPTLQRCARPRKRPGRRWRPRPRPSARPTKRWRRRRPSGKRAEAGSAREGRGRAGRVAPVLATKPSDKADAKPESVQPGRSDHANARPRPSARLTKRRQRRKRPQAQGQGGSEIRRERGAAPRPATDRQRLQLALTSLGFDTRGTDGFFGPRSREMIAAWQKARRSPRRDS